MTLPGLWILVGSVTSIANLFPRLLHQKFMNGMISEVTQKGLKKSGSMFSRISGELGLVGWMMPALFVASLTDMLEVYLVVYCFFYLVSAVIITLVLICKVNTQISG